MPRETRRTVEWIMLDDEGRILTSGQAAFDQPATAGEAYDSACVVADQVERALLALAAVTPAELLEFASMTRAMRAAVLADKGPPFPPAKVLPAWRPVARSSGR